MKSILQILIFIILVACFNTSAYQRKLTADNIDQTYKEIQESGTEEEKLRSEKMMRIMEMKALREKSLTELLQGKSFEEHVKDFKNRDKETN